MSGGAFDHHQYYMQDIIDEIDNVLKNKRVHDKDWDTIRNNYSDETFSEFKKGVEYLRKGYVYAQRIDWLLSGDDGEESFHERLKEELDKLKQG